jgi:glycosyltransferase involved in cell wall biosynthesis
MKIAYLSLLAPPDQHAVSGVPKVSETLLREFETLPGLRVEAITLMDGLPQEITRERGNVRHHYLPCRPKGKTTTFYWFERRRLQHFVRELKVDLAHGQPSGEYLLAATGCGLPHVITIHGLVFRETAGMSLFNSERLAGWMREKLQQQAAKRADNIISISPYVDDYLRGWTRGQIHPVANPIDPEFFEIAPPARDGLRIICVGIVSDRKNQALLVRACHFLHQQGIPFECHIVGPFGSGADEKMRRLIQEFGLAGKVLLKGKVSRSDLLAEYEWSNAVVRHLARGNVAAFADSRNGRRTLCFWRQRRRHAETVARGKIRHLVFGGKRGRAGNGVETICRGLIFLLGTGARRQGFRPCHLQAWNRGAPHF